MSIPFNADEILQMAEQIERNGARFYRRAALDTTDSGTRQVLNDLAAMEDEHEKVFSAMRADLSQEEREPTVGDPYGESVLYLRGMADGGVFDVKADPDEWLKGKETMEEVLKTAIALEKDSIVFYLGLKDVVPERLGRQRVDDIIRQEMSHIAMLAKEVASLKR